MGAIDSALSFLTKQVAAANDLCNEAKQQALAGKLGFDDLFKLSAKFSAGTIDRWLGALPMGGGVPLAFATVGAGATKFSGDPISVAPPPINVDPQDPKPYGSLIVLNTTNPAATGTPLCTLDSDGHLKIDVDKLVNLTKGDAFLVVAFYKTVGGGQRPIAQLILTVV